MLRAGVKAQIFAGIIPPFMGVLNNLSFAIVAGVGAWMVLATMITVGVIASFVNYTRQFTRPLAEMANQFTMIQSAIAGAERVFQVLDEEPEPADDNNAHVFEAVKGKVEFSDKCYLCLRCVHQCPVEAIQIGKITREKFRYKGPEANYKPERVLERYNIIE